MKRTLSALLLLAAINLTGCASFSLPWGSDTPEVKPIEVLTKPVEKTPLAIKQPDPLKVKGIKWYIITKDNAEKVLSDLEASGEDPVLFGLTDKGYEDLSIMFSEIRNFISIQRNIIEKYKDYYETPSDAAGAPPAAPKTTSTK